MRRETSWPVRRLLHDRSSHPADWRADGDEAGQRVASGDSQSLAQPIRERRSRSRSTGRRLELVAAAILMLPGRRRRKLCVSGPPSTGNDQASHDGTFKGKEKWEKT